MDDLLVDVPMKNGDLPMKNGDLPIKNGDLPIENGDSFTGSLPQWITDDFFRSGGRVCAALFVGFAGNGTLGETVALKWMSPEMVNTQDGWRLMEKLRKNR